MLNYVPSTLWVKIRPTKLSPRSTSSQKYIKEIPRIRKEKIKKEEEEEEEVEVKEDEMGYPRPSLNYFLICTSKGTQNQKEKKKNSY